MYASISVTADRLVDLVPLTSSKYSYLDWTTRLSIRGNLMHETRSVREGQDEEKIRMPQLEKVVWATEPRQAGLIHSDGTNYEGELAESSWMTWNATHAAVAAIHTPHLVISGPFTALQCTYADFDHNHHPAEKRLTFIIDSLGDFSADCPPPSWASLDARPRRKHDITIVLASELLEDSGDLHVRFPLYTAFLDRLAYMVYIGMIRLTLVGFQRHTDEKHIYRARIEGDDSGSRWSRLDVRDLASCLLFKLRNVYTTDEGESNKVALLDHDTWLHGRLRPS